VAASCVIGERQQLIMIWLVSEGLDEKQKKAANRDPQSFRHSEISLFVDRLDSQARILATRWYLPDATLIR
jgi:hypothetical protein